MVNNEDNSYIILKKDLYRKYGFTKSLILQTLINNGGEFIGSTGQLTDVIGVVTNTSVKNHLKELIENGVIKKIEVDGWVNRYTLLTENEIALKKRKVPDSVKRIVQRLEEIHKGK